MGPNDSGVTFLAELFEKTNSYNEELSASISKLNNTFTGFSESINSFKIKAEEEIIEEEDIKEVKIIDRIRERYIAESKYLEKQKLNEIIEDLINSDNNNVELDGNDHNSDKYFSDNENTADSLYVEEDTDNDDEENKKDNTTNYDVHEEPMFD